MDFYRTWTPSRPKILMSGPTQLSHLTHVNISTREPPEWVSAENNDPMIIFPKLKASLAEFESFYIEMAATTPLKSAMMVIYLAERKNKFSEEKKLSTMVKADGKYHPYLINIPKNIGGLSREAFKFVRIDPLDCSGKFSVGSVQLLPRELSPKFDIDRGLLLLGDSDLTCPEHNGKGQPGISHWIECKGPQLHCMFAKIPVDDVEYEYLLIEMAAKAEFSRISSRITFYSGHPDNGKADEIFEYTLALPADGLFHKKMLFLANHPGTGTEEGFTYIRVTPLIKDGSFCIKQFKLLPKRFRNGLDKDKTRRPILYIHIPKSAGNAVNQLLMKYLPQEAILECRKPGTNLIDFGPLDKYALVTGHFGHKAVEMFKHNKPMIFTVLRHPLDQVTSFYYYLRAQPLPSSKYPGFQKVMEIVHSEGLLEFVTSDSPNVRIITENHQTWKIGAGEVRWGGIKFVPRTTEMLNKAKAHLVSYEFVGLQEDLLNTIILMGYKLNLPIVKMKIPRINITKERKPLNDLTPKEKDAILERNKLDIELYHFARKLFLEQLEGMLKKVGQDRYLEWKKILNPEEDRDMDDSGSKRVDLSIQKAPRHSPELPKNSRNFTYSSHKDKVSRRWARYALDREAGREVQRLFATQHPTYRRCLNRAYFNDFSSSWGFLIHHLPRRPCRRALEIGCGIGNLAIEMITHKIADHIDAVDLSKQVIEVARRRLTTELANRIDFIAEDCNTISLHKDTYDLVYCSQSLHHILELEHLLNEVSKALTPDGILYISDYIGPSRMQWTDNQLYFMNQILAVLPDSYLADSRHQFSPKKSIKRIPVEVMLDNDPSEGVRSSDILDILSQTFDILELRPSGQTLTYELFRGIIHNFDENNEKDNAILELICLLEKFLIDESVLPSDFVHLVAKKRT